MTRDLKGLRVMWISGAFQEDGMATPEAGVCMASWKNCRRPVSKEGRSKDEVRDQV